MRKALLLEFMIAGLSAAAQADEAPDLSGKQLYQNFCARCRFGDRSFTAMKAKTRRGARTVQRGKSQTSPMRD